MAEDEQREHAQQQFAPVHRAGQQHAGQRGQRHHPGIDGQHQAHMFDRLAEAGADVTEQPNRDELAGVEDKGGQGQGDDAEPALAVAA